MRCILSLAVLVSALAASPALLAGGSRVKDIAVVAGARDNQLVGYGLVVGLAGNGDKNPVYTLQTMANILQRYGLTVPSRNAFRQGRGRRDGYRRHPRLQKAGTRLDVTVSAMGDSQTLQGGVLVQTPLIGADGKVYAVAQGALSIGGISGGTDAANVTKNHPTVGQIADGALVEREIPATIFCDNHVELLLREPDFTSAARLALAVNGRFPDSSHALDSTTIRVEMPKDFTGSPVDFISDLESVEVDADVPARIIINERTGTIVATSRIRIASCAVSHGNLTISIASTQDVSQPNALSQTGATAVTTRTDTKIKEDKGALVPLPELPTVEKVAAALNSLGVTPRDMMSMFQAMKQAGALQAELLMR